MKLSRVILFVVIGALLVWCLDNRWLVQRYVSFVVNGYDAHTAPPDWYEPVYPLAHGDGMTLPVAMKPTIPGPVLDEVLAYAESQQSMALIIARGGQIELEKYWPPFNSESLFNPQSMSKTVLAMLLGMALADGEIASLDDPVSRYVQEWVDQARGEITIRQLLHMSGGLAQIAPDYSPVPWSPGVRQHFGDDFNAPLLDMQLADIPGRSFDYNNNENNLLGLALERATGIPYPEYLGERLWQPLGLGPAYMYLDRPGGNVMKSCCILSRPIDWLKLGQLLLDGGRYQGNPLLPDQWVARMTEPSPNYANYGFQVWLGPSDRLAGASPANEPPVDTTRWWAPGPFEADVVMMLGYGFQHVWVIPSLDLVVVRASRVWPAEAWDQTRIPNLLIGGLAGQ